MNLWQSFGYGTDEENVSLLQSVQALLRPGGRMVLDIYHREFFEREGYLEDRISERNGTRFIERKSLAGHRLRVEIEYLSGEPTRRDRFDWRLYSPTEIESLATELGLRMNLNCREFTETSPPSHDVPRVQYVFESE